jgi:hypothetical protein
VLLTGLFLAPAVMDRCGHVTREMRRDILLGWLAFHRDALLAKCDGITADQLDASLCRPSRLSLLELVRHMAEVERAYGSTTSTARWTTQTAST